jgi:hypothetical protein
MIVFFLFVLTTFYGMCLYFIWFTYLTWFLIVMIEIIINFILYLNLLIKNCGIQLSNKDEYDDKNVWCNSC